MDRQIEVKVFGNHLWKDGNRAGVQGEGNVTTLRISFDEGWDDFAKSITFFDAKGRNPVKIVLGVDRLEDIANSTLVYLCKIPFEPLAEAGWCSFVIDGSLADGRQRSVETKLEVLPAKETDEAKDPGAVTPTQAEQLQTEIQKITKDVQQAVKETSAIMGMTVSAETLDPDAEAAVEKRENADGTPNLHFMLPSGKEGPEGKPGQDGRPGSDGQDGAEGKRGKSIFYTDYVLTKAVTNVPFSTINTGGVSLSTTDIVGCLLIDPEGNVGIVASFSANTGCQVRKLFSVAGKDGSAGADGVPGKDGKSAYQYAKEAGYTGTEQEFAEALANGTGGSGEAGKDGEDGTTFTPSVDANGNLSWTNDGGLPNPETVNIRGPKGWDGQDGEGIYVAGWTVGRTYTEVVLMSTKTGTVTRVQIPNGRDGFDGDPGEDGADGITPHIGTNGNWYIGTTDTGIPATGPAGKDGQDGSPGADGKDGSDGVSPTVSVAAITGGHRITITDKNGTKTVDVMNGNDGAPGENGSPGADGQDGADGVGIASIAQTTTSTADGGSNVFTVTLTNGTKATFTVKNGSKGSTGADGKDGQNGSPGADGKDGSDGAPGQRGTGILKVTTAPSSYTTANGSYTPKYRIALSTVKAQAKVDEVLLGDLIQYSFYQYLVDHMDATYAYTSVARTSIRGAAGTTPVKGTDYWTAADKQEIVDDVLEQMPGGGSAEGAVLYTEQTLTEEQKAQARANIGAMGDTDMGESETLQIVYTTTYPNTTTFAYTETTTENHSYCLAKPSEIKGGLLTVDYDPAEIPEGAASSFQLNILLFDEDGNPYKHTGSSTTWSGENVNPTYYDPGAGQSYGAVKSPFTVKIPNGCSVMVTVRCVNSGSATINRAFNKWAHDGGVTFTVSTGGSAFLKQNVGTEYAGQYLVVDEKGNIVPSAEGGGGTTALTASINPNIKSVNHRGFGTAPENTLSAFRLSKKMGFDIAECDVRMTSDGHYVLLHDSTVDRTSEGTGAITSLTFDYVRGLDFGSYKSAEYAGEQIPTFDECMKLCRDIGLSMYIDMKISSATQAIVNDLVNTVKKYRMLDKVTWISHKADLTLVRNADPSARLALIAEDVNSTTITNATALKNDANEVIIDAGYSYITDDMVVLCQDADIPLEIYGLDTAAAIIASNSYISGFTTDTVIAGVELYKAAMDL